MGRPPGVKNKPKNVQSLIYETLKKNVEVLGSLRSSIDTQRKKLETSLESPDIPPKERAECLQVLTSSYQTLANAAMNLIKTISTLDKQKQDDEDENEEEILERLRNLGMDE